MLTILTIVACLAGYGLVGGTTYALMKLVTNSDEAQAITGVIWPVGLPLVLAWIFGARMTEYLTDYLESQKQKRQEKRYRIAEERREREREIQREMDKLDEEEAEGRFCVRQQAGR